MAPSWGSGYSSPPWKGTREPVTSYLGFSTLLFLLLPPAPGTNLGPPDQLVSLVLVGLIDLYERVRFAEQILGT